MSEPTYPIAPGGIFHSVQGEGLLAGLPMLFVRLAGCPVGCKECDTDYSVFERLTAREIIHRAVDLAPAATDYCWVTGGEPTAVPGLADLCGALRRFLKVCLATAGTRLLPEGFPVDFVSISPHKLDATWVLRRGDEVKLVPGLHGLDLATAAGHSFGGFAGKFVQPLWGDPGSLSACLAFLAHNPGWRLSFQSHKLYALP